MALAPGTSLDTYEVLGLLGAGGMGEVYRARDPVLRREVAIKVLPAYFSQDPDRLRRFEQEAQAAAALNHPNILAIHQFGTFEGAPYLVSELLDGVTLRQLMERGPIPVRKTIEYGIQIAYGLAAAHERNIVHRDLKPENLFVVKDGRVKILDFGLAKLIQPQFIGDGNETTITYETEPGKVMGTVGYMSPEQIRGNAVDHRADIFAFGAILYEMLTGKRAFQRRTPAESMTAILNDEPPALSQSAQNIPPGLQRVIHRCLEKSPEQRFHSAADLAFALGALSEPGFSSSAAIDATGPRSKRSMLAWSLVALSVVGLALVAYLVLSSRSSSAPVRIAEYTQLTHDGHPGAIVGTDGSRLFLDRGIMEPIGQVSIGGGEIVPLAINVTKPWADDISPDGSTLLVESYEQGISPTRPLYSVPVLGGSRRFLANVAGAGYTRDGKNVIYGLPDGNTYMMRSDGSEPHKIASMGIPDWLDWSPDGKTIRFTKNNQIWEMSSSFTNVHQLLPGWRTDHDQCCGSWSPDGRFYFFLSGPHAQLWVRDERHSLFRSQLSPPIQLTSGPIPWASPTVAKDGKTIFAAGWTARGELVRFDSKSKQPKPFLGGISADSLSFSKDGRAVAYVSYPEGTLWKAKSDGSERMQLTDPPPRVESLNWSPDGSQIVFSGTSEGGPREAYIVSAKGGAVHRLLPSDNDEETDPNWSADGGTIIFATGSVGRKASTIRIFDVTSRQITTLPESAGMISPHWSPDGRYIMTEALDLSKTYLYDEKSQQWSTLYHGICEYPSWSKDSRFVFVVRYASEPAILRVPITGGEPQVVVDLKDFHYTGNLQLWMGLDPTDAPLMLRNVGTADVFALRLEEH
jgi:serine/threonine protein kinase/Tol biopolymer transport system component